MILVVIQCGLCGGTAGIGVDVDHATHAITESGGRVFDDGSATLNTCKRCSRGTR